MTPDAFLG